MLLKEYPRKRKKVKSKSLRLPHQRLNQYDTIDRPHKIISNLGMTIM